MPVYNLLEVDPDKIFKEHTISEIQEIQTKLQAEVERKREELKTMVGERYRDLIEAADTISDMKATAEGIIYHIDQISGKCQQLQQKHLIGFKSDISCAPSQQWISVNKLYYSVAIQIKILMGFPEQLWAALEKQDYILAAQLYLLAKHINTGIQLQSDGEITITFEQITQWFPTLASEWDCISHFFKKIISGCEQQLQKHDIANDVASSCMCALVLLEGLNSSQLLTRLLTLRTESLKLILLSEEQHVNVKTRIHNSIKLLVHTISLLHCCFVDGCPDSSAPEGLVWRQLKNITDRSSAPTISVIGLQNMIGIRMLPNTVLEFRPSTAEAVEPVLPSVMQEALSQWLEWVQVFTSKELSNLLQLVVSLRGLQAARLDRTPLPNTWDSMCQALLIPRGLDLWANCFQPLLTSRACQLVNQKWRCALRNMQDLLQTAVLDVSQEKCSQPEHDLRWFVWKEWNTDIPQVDSQKTNKGNEGNYLFLGCCATFVFNEKESQFQQRRGIWPMAPVVFLHQGQTGKLSYTNILGIPGCLYKQTGLLMKSRGYSPCVEKLCASLDSHLESLLQDVQHYTASSSSLDCIDTLLPGNKHPDSVNLQDHMQNCTVDSVKELIEFVKAKCGETGRQTEACTLLMARFLQAMCDLCPQLQQCLLRPQTFTAPFTNQNVSMGSCLNPWLEVCSILQSESLMLWSRWKDITCSKINSLTTQTLVHATEVSKLLDTMPQWDVVTIEEEGEEGSSIQSNIKVPSQPSFPMQSVVYQICQQINTAAPHTLPRQIHQDIIQCIVSQILDFYMAVNSNKPANQVQALQYLLDVKYLTMLLVPRDNKLLMTKSKQISDKLENEVDPFDLDVFAPYIQTNIKKSVQRTQSLLGILIAWPEKLCSISLQKPGGSAVEVPSVLPLCSTAPWFPLLPVTGPVMSSRLAPATVVRLPEKHQPKETTAVKPKVEATTGDIVRSGAAAFFGTMSTDWFR